MPARVNQLPGSVSPTRSSLAHHIGCVVCGRAQKQVIGTDARRIVTVMKYPEPRGNWPVMHFPGQAVGLGCTSFWVAQSNAAVSPQAGSASPQPAGRGLFDFCPKPCCERDPRAESKLCGTRYRATLALAHEDLITGSPELLTTGQAVPQNVIWDTAAGWTAFGDSIGSHCRPTPCDVSPRPFTRCGGTLMEQVY